MNKHLLEGECYNNNYFFIIDLLYYLKNYNIIMTQTMYNSNDTRRCVGVVVISRDYFVVYNLNNVISSTSPS